MSVGGIPCLLLTLKRPTSSITHWYVSLLRSMYEYVYTVCCTAVYTSCLPGGTAKGKLAALLFTIKILLSWKMSFGDSHSLESPRRSSDDDGGMSSIRCNVKRRSRKWRIRHLWLQRYSPPFSPTQWFAFWDEIPCICAASHFQLLSHKMHL